VTDRQTDTGRRLVPRKRIASRGNKNVVPEMFKCAKSSVKFRNLDRDRQSQKQPWRR